MSRSLAAVIAITLGFPILAFVAITGSGGVDPGLLLMLLIGGVVTTFSVGAIFEIKRLVDLDRHDHVEQPHSGLAERLPEARAFEAAPLSPGAVSEVAVGPEQPHSGLAERLPEARAFEAAPLSPGALSEVAVGPEQPNSGLAEPLSEPSASEAAPLSPAAVSEIPVRTDRILVPEDASPRVEVVARGEAEPIVVAPVAETITAPVAARTKPRSGQRRRASAPPDEPTSEVPPPAAKSKRKSGSRKRAKTV